MTENPSYDDDFEPSCDWIRTKDGDTLVIHLPKFKNEQLKIHVFTDTRVLKISGQRPLKASKRSSFCKEVKVYPSKRGRFSKEVRISKECEVYEIRAKFVNGLLRVVMPKEISAPTSPDDKITKPPTCNKESSLPSENARKSCSKMEKFVTCWRLCCP